MEKNNINVKGPKPEKPIPKRSKQAIPELLDLFDYYTSSLDDDWLGKSGANLRSLPKGVHALPKGYSYTKAAFDIRGLIQLASKKSIEKTGIDFPAAMKGIKVNFKGAKINFLHGTSWSAEENTKIGEYILHYADGQIKSIPIIYGRNVKDWWIKKDVPDTILTDADIAWTGENEASHKMGYNIQVYKYKANNPLPDLEIKTIDFVSGLTESAPFLIAMTIERETTSGDSLYEWFDSVSIYNPIIQRSSKASLDQVDLSNYYNASLDDDWLHHSGHDLHDVPKGLQVFGGITFDVRGLIQLAGRSSPPEAESGSQDLSSLRVTGLALPEELLGIKVNRMGRSVNFLHACAFSSEEGSKIGEYIIHYANGEIKIAPIVYGKDIMDWWVPQEGPHCTEAEEVWYGSNAATRRAGQKTRLMKYTWQNPLPDVEITAIDFISSLNKSAPFLVAITIEP